ncbi:dipeptidase [Cytophagaceae bacterium 50C-KIRBA]|uniref:Dipeptidase n=1 Tax=Aquirufa beregesia TaxID=2516556 RepID=A0ABX0EXD2_9BACT|nr:dipeptidase [Aquirufa beregesia]NGZ45249.1 dipeptidase [Aquirufa beregesia]
MKKTQAYIQANQQRFLEELLDLLRIPSISADPTYAGDVRRAAEFIANNLRQSGAEHVRLEETAGFPVVYGEKIIDTKAPTVLVYGHYDVQPADPLDLWESPPFEPVIKDEIIYARGSCDDKGQVFMHVKAFEAMLATDSLPCNIKFMIEGEEEIGSNNLAIFVANNKELLQADVILISDTSIIANDVPSIDVGLRGLSYLEVTVQGPNRDLHSGVYGGAVANPINILCEMISSMHDEFNQITIPGFYEAVQELSASDRAAMAQTPFDLEAYQKDLGIASVHGEKGYSTLERASIRPTLDVNGIWGGYIGEGAKTVLPSLAHAKISMRLVPNQSSEKITQLFTEHFKSIAPKGVKVTVTPHHGGEAYVMPTDTIAFQAASKALTETFGKEPVPTRGGGSIPVPTVFERELGIKSVLMGFGLDSDAIHSPNEHFGLFNFYKGIETIPHFFKHFYALSTK